MSTAVSSTDFAVDTQNASYHVVCLIFCDVHKRRIMLMKLCVHCLCAN